MGKKRGAKKKARRTALDDVLSQLRFRIGQRADDWSRMVERLGFQLPVVDGDGIPSNIHLLSTLREAAILYAEIQHLRSMRDLLTTDVLGHRRALSSRRPSAEVLERGQFDSTVDQPRTSVRLRPLARARRRRTKR